MTVSQEVAAALFKVESIHHIHADQCLCGFKSAVSRDRTKHIMEVTLEAANHGRQSDAIEATLKYLEDVRGTGYRVDGDYIVWAINKALQGEAA